MIKKVGLHRIILNIFRLTTTEAMSSYQDRFVKIGQLSTRFISKTKSVTPQFFAFLTKVTYYLTVAKVLKKSVL